MEVGGQMNANQVYGVLKKYVEDTLAGAGALKGDKGDKGDTGEQGIQGPQGIQGIQGEKGDKGDQGLPGVDGVDGVDGVSVTVAEHGANDATNYRLEITTKDGTIVTQNLIGRSCKWLEGTELASTQEYTVLEIADSFDGDYYLNKDTCYVYHRVDDDTTANKWYYVGTLQGAEGDDAYEVAVKEGFIGTRAEWLASLVGRVELIEKVWSKPNLFADTTELDTWYYYKVNNPDNDLALAGVEDGNAWLNKCVMVATKDYLPGNYAYYNGLRYLCFIDAAITSPALTDPDHIYYVLYNEKEQKCAACRCDLDGSNHEMLSSTWVDVFESATLPDGYEEVMLTEYTQLGKWVQTVYIGNSKEFAHEVTITTGANVQGFVTSATLLALLGEGHLKTVDQTIKGAINEHETLLRGTNNSKVLNTKEKDVFGAINEIFSRQYANVAKCEETSVRAFCDKYVAEKGTEAELTSYFFYSMGIATDVPEGNNGWGYCHCIITQDPRYKILIYYAPDLRKVFMTYDGDTGWSNEWTSNLTNEDIATVLDDTVTDEQVPSALTVYELTKDKNLKTYSTLEQIGLDRTTFTLTEVASTLTDNSILIDRIRPSDTNVSILPKQYGTFVAIRRNYDKVKFFFFPNEDNEANTIYFCGYHPITGVTEWSKVCTTSVPDVSDVPINFISGTPFERVNATYSVKDGWCTIRFSGGRSIPELSNTIEQLVVAENIPKPIKGVWHTGQLWGSSDSAYLLSVNNEGKLFAWMNTSCSGCYAYMSISYQVADDWRP